MPDDDGSQLERARRHAREQVARLLGIDVEPEALFELAFEELGAGRAARCLKLVRRGRLTRRADSTASIAALIVGTRALGEAWWERTGDALLQAGGPESLDALAQRISDDCADARWGAPIGYVDLNDPRVDDRVELPAGAGAGDTFVAAFDPGCRVVVEVCERGDSLGSTLGELRYDETAEIDWAWGLACDIGPIRLAGEVEGAASDPYATPVAAEAVRRLRAWAEAHESDEQRLGGPWRSRSDLWEAYHRLGLPYQRDGTWHGFEIVTRAAVDGDPDELAYALARLDRT